MAAARKCNGGHCFCQHTGMGLSLNVVNSMQMLMAYHMIAYLELQDPVFNSHL